MSSEAAAGGAAPYYRSPSGDVTLYWGDAAAVLRALPAGSVHACITSPPYWNLRDYQTGGWEGGDESCDHLGVPKRTQAGFNERYFGKEFAADKQGELRQPYRAVCGKCGARRVDAQIGLEATVEEYVENLVAVFREVRRVLHPTGTVFLNIGDSYCSNPGNGRGGGSTLSGSPPHLSGGPHGQSCGNDGRAGQGSPAGDRASQSPDDGHTGTGSSRTTGTDPRPGRAQVAASCLRIRGHMGELLAHLPSADCSDRQPTPQSFDAIAGLLPVAIREAERALDVLASTSSESSPPLPAGTTLDDAPASYRWSLRSFVACAHRFLDTSGEPSTQRDGMAGTAALCAELADHIRCTAACCSLVASWLNPPQVQPQYTTKPKDLLMIPARVAIALRDDGWWLRAMIPWLKRNAMPESADDRPTTATEYVFLLSKASSYYYDQDAVRVPQSAGTFERYGNGKAPRKTTTKAYAANEGEVRANAGFKDATPEAILPNGRNRRNADWWFDSLAAILAGATGLLADEDGAPLALPVNPAAYPGAHFATFSPKLVEPMILASTSARGCCPACGAPWQRVTERESSWPARKAAGGTAGNVGVSATYQNGVHGTRVDHDLGGAVRTTGWRAGCACDAGPPVPAVVLDPFAGSGTVGVVARKHGRHFIGIDLSAAYLDLARERLGQLALPGLVAD